VSFHERLLQVHVCAKIHRQPVAIRRAGKPQQAAAARTEDRSPQGRGYSELLMHRKRLMMNAPDGQQFWVVAAEREDAVRFIVRADEKLTCVELEAAIRVLGDDRHEN
jgi:hypothetical protein